MLLYVEDEILIQDGVVVALTAAGYEIVVANDGAEALAKLDAHDAALSGVITDINLGDGPSGWDIARDARQRRAALPIVYLSAASEHEWTSLGVPGSVMIAKPFAAAQVVVAVSSLLVASAPGD